MPNRAYSLRMIYSENRCTLFRIMRRSGGKLSGEHEGLARASHVRPVAIEVGNQPLHVVALHRTIERGLIGELVGRLMNGRIGQRPEAPRLDDAERFRRIRQMLGLIPEVKR